MITKSESHLLERLKFMLDVPFSNLEEAVEDIEVEAEKELVHTLSTIGISGSVKTDRKSLPVHKAIVRKKYFTSYGNSILNTTVLKRDFLRELLDTGQFKVRFYVDIELLKNGEGKIYAFLYTINYYEHGND